MRVPHTDYETVALVVGFGVPKEVKARHAEPSPRQVDGQCALLAPRELSITQTCGHPGHGALRRRPADSDGYDDWGGPGTYPHMAAGWAVAGDTPFMWTKQIPSNYGGTRNGLIVSWPKRIKAKNEIRSQWHHVIDVAPTVLEAASLPEPKSVNGVVQAPIEGVSMVYTFDNADAKSTHKTQYFEIMGNRGIYSDGWFAGTIHRAPWEQLPRRKLQEDIWELYDTQQRLQPGQRPGGFESGEAQGTAGRSS